MVFICAVQRLLTYALALLVQPHLVIIDDVAQSLNTAQQLLLFTVLKRMASPFVFVVVFNIRDLMQIYASLSLVAERQLSFLCRLRLGRCSPC
jgi:ABC-type branched-subunit amino acid transport system ATPase component